MLTRLIVNVYAWIIEIFLWLVLLVASVVGYHYTVPILRGAGLILLEPQTGGKILGALVFASAVFLVSAVVMGPILVLFDIRRSIRSLEAKDGSFGAWVQRTERKEPSL
jgi:hypothetical protein